MSRVALIFIGHSHLSTIVSALVPREGETYDPEDGCEYFIFNTIQQGSNFEFSVPSEDGGYVLNPELVGLIDERVPANYQRVLVSMFGGNAHNALTLLEHPIPFDFILPERPDCPRISNTRLLPYGLISKFIYKLAEGYMLNLATLRNAFSDRSSTLSRRRQSAMTPMFWKIWKAISAIRRKTPGLPHAG
jgi:hypothetical protein